MTCSVLARYFPLMPSFHNFLPVTPSTLRMRDAQVDKHEVFRWPPLLPSSGLLLSLLTTAVYALLCLVSQSVNRLWVIQYSVRKQIVEGTRALDH